MVAVRRVTGRRIVSLPAGSLASRLIHPTGLAVVEFLPPIAPGMELAPFMQQLEQVVERESDRLMAEAGFEVSDADG